MSEREGMRNQEEREVVTEKRKEKGRKEESVCMCGLEG